MSVHPSFQNEGRHQASLPLLKLLHPNQIPSPFSICGNPELAPPQRSPPGFSNSSLLLPPMDPPARSSSLWTRTGLR
ncbi:hypothetical protein H8959_001095 [Pygathrix nigripes]